MNNKQLVAYSNNMLATYASMGYTLKALAGALASLVSTDYYMTGGVFTHGAINATAKVASAGINAVKDLKEKVIDAPHKDPNEIIMNPTLKDRWFSLPEGARIAAFALPAVGLIAVVLKKVLEKDKHELNRLDLSRIDKLLARIHADKDDKNRLLVDLTELDEFLDNIQEGKNIKKQLIIQLRNEGLLADGFFKGLKDIKYYSGV